MRLDEVVDRDRLREGEFLAGCPVILRERIDAEDLQVDQFFGLLGSSVPLGDRPEKAAGFGIPKMIHEVPVGPGRQFEIREVVVTAVRRRKRPENAARQKPATCRAFSDHHVGIDEAEEAAIFDIADVRKPEGQDVTLQLPLCASRQSRQIGEGTC